MIQLIEYDNTQHRQSVIELWERVFGYATAHNSPELAIDRKLAVDDGLFFVALASGQVVGTLMAGYDGHRGWLYSPGGRPATAQARHRPGPGAPRRTGPGRPRLPEDQPADPQQQRRG